MTEGDLGAAQRMLDAASSAVLLAHVNPDADALGSALALGLALRERGVAVAVGFAEPAAVPDSLAELPGQDLIRPVGDLPEHPDLVVTLDVGAAERLGALQPMLTTAPVLVIDHHRTNTRFGTHHLIDHGAEATGVLVVRLLDVMGVRIGADMASCLYAALATDTVSFRHVTSHTHHLAARLVECGARPAELLAPITDTHPFGWLGMLSGVLARAVSEPEVAGGAPLVHTCVTASDAAGLRAEDVDSVIDIVRTTAGAGVAVVAKQTAPDRWQVSLRSGGRIDVAAVAARLSGGGHSRAAGFSHDGDYDSLIDRVRRALAARSVAYADGAAESGITGGTPAAGGTRADASEIADGTGAAESGIAGGAPPAAGDDRVDGAPTVGVRPTGGG